METLEHILRQHGARYPQMEPRDAVKLIYQNEFGGGHLIRDPEACDAALRREYETVEQVPGTPLLEPIGNGVVRVMLRALEGSGYSIEQLRQDFVRSSREHRGNLDHFLQKLDILRNVTAAGIFTFDSGELADYLEAYKDAGYPMVSHSARYREAYRPAYRVVDLCVLPEELHP
jgi:hypothetical protein